LRVLDETIEGERANVIREKSSVLRADLGAVGKAKVIKWYIAESHTYSLMVLDDAKPDVSKTDEHRLVLCSDTYLMVSTCSSNGPVRFRHDSPSLLFLSVKASNCVWFFGQNETLSA
jgi:hypothetical protein